MANEVTYIPNRLKNAANDGYVAGAEDIIDDAKGKNQQTINSNVDTELGNRYTKDEVYNKSETYNRRQVNEMYATVDDFTPVIGSLPARGESGKLYYAPSMDNLSYTEYLWLDESFVPLATHYGDISIFINTIENIGYFSDDNSVNSLSASENGLLKQDGTIDTSVSGYTTSDFLSIPDNAVSVCLHKIFPTINVWCGFCLYDSEQNFIACSELANEGSASGSGVMNLIKYPNARYFRFSPSINQKDSFVSFGYNLQTFSDKAKKELKNNGLCSLWEYSYAEKNKSLLKVDGTVETPVESQREGYRTTGFIEIDNYSSAYGYHVFPNTGTRWVGICVYDKNKNFLCFGNTDALGNFDISFGDIPNAAYIRISFNDTGDGYVYITKSATTLVNTLIQYLPQNTVSWDNTKPNGKLLKEDGTIDEIDKYYTSDFIEINGIFNIEGTQVFPYLGNGWVGVCLYDKDKNLVAKFGGSGDDSSIKMCNYFPEAKYMRFSLKSTDFSTASMTYTCTIKENTSNVRDKYYQELANTGGVYFQDFANTSDQMALLKTDGTVDYSVTSQHMGYRTTDFIAVHSSSTFEGYRLFPNQGYNWCGVCVYDKNKTLLGCYGGASRSGYLKLSLKDVPNASYIRVSFNDIGDGYFYLIDDMNEVYESIVDYLPTKTISWANVLPNNQLLKEDGTIDNIEGYYTSDYIEINGVFNINGTQIFPYLGNGWVGVCLYDENKALVSVFGSDPETFDISMKEFVPHAKYMRFSLKSVNLPTASMTYTCFAGDDGNSNNKILYVKKDGTGDYTSLSECVLNAMVTPNTIVHVGAGVYDIIEEFKSLYGENYFETLSNNQGLVLKNRVTLVFSSNAKVVCNYSGANEYVMKNFSVFNSGIYGFTLKNAKIEASRVRYCIHDERWDSTDKYENNYIDCDMYLDNTQNEAWTSRQCIGGGLGTNGLISIYGCMFESEGTDGSETNNGASVSWHNTPSVGKSKIIVNSCYFKGKGALRLSWYGESTEKTQALVSNNSFGSPIVFRAENSSAVIQNVEIIEWNNTIREQ